MSVLTQIGVDIDRIKTAKASIKAAIEGKGITVPSDTKIDGMSVYIDAIDTSENLDSVLTEQESIIDQIQAALEGKAFPKGVSLDVITAANLPATVVDNQIVVITSTSASKIYVSTNEPTNPANGDIWVKITEGDYQLNLTEETPYCSLGLTAAKQYSSVGTWADLDGYIGISGTWGHFGLSLPAKGTALSEWTWEQIITLANSGADCSEYFAVGDEKTLTLSTSEVVTAVIGDFYRNRRADGSGKMAALAFTFKNCLNNAASMNDSNTNVDSWNGSRMRNTNMADVFNTFPAELRVNGAVKLVEVMTTAGNKSTNLITTSDRLRIHSAAELSLSATTVGVEGTPYAYYAAGNRVKRANGTLVNYWLRSPHLNSSNMFAVVNTSGGLTYDNANGSQYVVCAFDI